MAKSARGTFIRAMVFVQITIVSVVLAINFWPAAKTCTLTELLGGVTDIFGFLLDYILKYLPSMILILQAVVFGILFLTHLKRSFSLLWANRPGPRVKFGFKQAVFLIIFILAFMPFFLPLIDHGKNLKPNSIYNSEGYNGCSALRELLNTSQTKYIPKFSRNGLGYNVQGVESSLSTMMRNNDTYKILVILGPNRIYNPLTELPFILEFINTGGSILIADEKGSTNWFVMELSLYSGFQVPFIEFPKGDLADNASCMEFPCQDPYLPPCYNPYFPVIKNFSSGHEVTTTPHNINIENKGVALNHASAIFAYEDIIASMLNQTIEGGAVTTIGASSQGLSFIDTNNDTYFDPNVDKWDPGIVMDVLTTFMCMIPEENKNELIQFASEKFMGSEPKTVFATSNLPRGRLFLAGDASFLNNQLIDDPRWSNANFAENIFQWLSFNQDRDNVTIYFDEYHIRPEFFEDFSSAYIYGIFIGYVNWLSSSAILAWVYPFLALWTLSRWLPKDPEKEMKKKKYWQRVGLTKAVGAVGAYFIMQDLEKKERKKAEEEASEFKIQYKTETAFVKKIKNLREGSDFNEPVLMLYRRVLRRLNRLLGDKEPTPDNIISLIKAASKKEITAKDDARLRTFFDTMDELKAKTGRKINTEDEFKDLFFEMTWVADWLNLNIM